MPTPKPIRTLADDPIYYRSQRPRRRPMPEEFWAGLAVGLVLGAVGMLLLSVFVWGHQW